MGTIFWRPFFAQLFFFSPSFAYPYKSVRQFFSVFSKFDFARFYNCYFKLPVLSFLANIPRQALSNYWLRKKKTKGEIRAPEESALRKKTANSKKNKGGPLEDIFFYQNMSGIRAKKSKTIEFIMKKYTKGLIKKNKGRKKGIGKKRP